LDGVDKMVSTCSALVIGELAAEDGVNFLMGHARALQRTAALLNFIFGADNNDFVDVGLSAGFKEKRYLKKAERASFLLTFAHELRTLLGNKGVHNTFKTAECVLITNNTLGKLSAVYFSALRAHSRELMLDNMSGAVLPVE
jgi:hypothetical protein